MGLFRRRPPAPAPVPAPTPKPVTIPASVYGVATEQFSEVAAFNAAAGKPVNVFSYYQSFYWDATFNTALAKQINAAGYTPMITWEPWNPNGNPNQPEYSLANLNAGKFDTLIKGWAMSIKALGFPVLLRFAHEMNGDWYPWGQNVNGNTPQQYIDAWNRVRLLFSAAGATNVTWVWSPNVDFPMNEWPGADKVDMIAVDGYNWDTSSPEQVFGATLNLLKPFGKPIYIGETGTPENSGKAKWITEFFTMVKSRGLAGFIWFNYNKEQNWRTDSSAASQAAFKKGVTS